MWAETKVRHGRLIIQGTLALVVITGAAVLYLTVGFGHWPTAAAFVVVLLAIGWWLDHRRERLWQEVSSDL